MSANSSAEDLERISAKWKGYDLPKGVREKISAIAEKLLNKVFDLFNLAGPFDENTSSKFGYTLASVVFPSFEKCYYIGYELASGKMVRAAGTPYLMVATSPIEDSILEIVKMVLVQDITKQDVARTMAMEISSLIGAASNDICILGIENFRRIGYR